MIQLSVIIVNYNVKHFLEQALKAVERASSNLQVETFVVDNASVDGSTKMVQEKFPWVQLIALDDNLGFSKGNNLAIKKAQGKYILLLNPDTVVGEHTFEKCIAFMEEHPKAGALGVKMIDGTGTFLPESKRGFPSPNVAFYKAFGLSRLFPKSKKFNTYHLGHLSESETNPIDVLSGAFMFIRKTALEKAGLLDETFFMYGEDIDLSYRLAKTGFQNYYLPETEIIHYKGESTKKGSLNYVKVFYQAMIIFVKKHFVGGKAKFLVALLQLAIFFRAILTLLSNWFQRLKLPILDGLLLVLGLFLIKDYWQYLTGKIYSPLYTQFNIPLYTLVWLCSIFFSGGYDKPIRFFKIIRGLIVGTIVISAIYGFLPEQYRASRAMIPMGAFWAAVVLIGVRLGWHFIKNRNFDVSGSGSKRLLIVGNEDEVKRTSTILNQVKVGDQMVGFVSSETSDQSDYLGDIKNLEQIIRTFEIDEVIFCSKDISNADIMQHMQQLGTDVLYKIVPEQSNSIIGSNSKNTAGDLHALDIDYAIESYMNKRNKRVFDILSSLFLIITLPISIWFVKRATSFIGNLFAVLIGKKTWVGYTNDSQSLPSLKPHVVSVYSQKDQSLISNHAQKLNLLYAKEYKTALDLKWLIKNFRFLGNA